MERARTGDGIVKSWHDIPLNTKLLSNVKSACLTRSSEAAENLFFNDAGGQSRFPGLKPFCTLIGDQPTYLHEWRGDLMAATTGRLFRINEQATPQDVTDVQISGNKRVIFARTPDQLALAAGGEIIQFAGEKTALLDPTGTAPLSTHIGFIDSFLLAVERDSGRFQHCNADDFTNWDPLNVFAANAQPDNLNGLLITPFRECLLTGLDSIEQFERLNNGPAPFYRRWAVGEGVSTPYALIFADNATWFVNKKREFVRLTGQTSTSKADDIGRSLEEIPYDQWDDAWAAEMALAGQKFIILQMPKAVNVYGTLGVTLLLDFRQNRWYSLFGWDTDKSMQTRWPGWSYYKLWDRHFVGGNGRVLELDVNTFMNDSVTQKVNYRTAHIDIFGECSVDNMRCRFKRGGGSSNTDEPVVRIRALKDNSQLTKWATKSLGKAGKKDLTIEFGGFGTATTWQFEVDMTDAAEYEFGKLQVQISKVGH
jgi:hypothetical protein